jgi:hypothetical protein
MNKVYIYISVFIIGVLIGTLIKLSNPVTKYVDRFQTKNLIKTDTLIETKIIKKAPIIIRESATITIVKDSLIAVKPFYASIDTNAIGIDTLSIKFFYPENQFDFRAVLVSDTNRIKTIRDSVFIEPPFYEKPLIVGGATFITTLLIFLGLK